MAKITVLIPVYNAPKAVDFLLKSLRDNTNHELVDEIIIGNDRSDSTTTELIDELVTGNNLFRHISRDKNLGFLENVNDLFRQAKGDIVVLLNSDTILPPRWAERVLSAFESDKNIALACPLTTNATNLVLKPAPGQHWLDVDRAISTIEPIYPNCAPIVGFFLCIRTAFFKGSDLLDPIYGNGYWEDTDLHFRSLQKGYRNIIIDNLFVFHSNHSPSFSIENDLKSINDTNRKIFYKRWRKQYDAMLKSQLKLGATNRHAIPSTVQHRYTYTRDLEVLFVLPAVHANSGGISVVMNFVDELNQRGIAAAVYTYGHCDNTYVHTQLQNAPFLDKQDVLNQISKIRYVFATSHDSHDHAQAFAVHYGAKFCCFVQGPEAAFCKGKDALKMSSRYKNYDINIAVSDYLAQYLQAFDAKAVKIPLGPSKLAFYPSERAKRNTKAIAACVRVDDLKGTGRLMANLAMAEEAGFEIHLFGETEGWDIFKKAKCHGSLTSAQLSKLFSQVGYYLDCSHMEGLGLLPLEAAFSGCIPIIAQELGLKGLVADKEEVIVLPSEFPGINFYRSLLTHDNHQMRETGKRLQDKVSIESAVSSFIDQLKLVQKHEKPITLVAAPDQHSPSLVEERNYYRDQLNEVYKSKSWTLTKPIRFSGRVFRKLKRIMKTL